MSEGNDFQRIVILGAGSWGITLACHMHRCGYGVSLWEYREDVAEKLQQERRSLELLPEILLAESIEVSSQLEELLVDQSMMLVFVVPSHVLREVAQKVALLMTRELYVISAVKGIENGTFKRMSEILEEELPDGLQSRIAVLSGPSHAEEVSRQIPTSVVAASLRQDVAETVQKVFMSPHFRVYTNHDLIGVELGGALKNIIAIAAGISDGLGFGDNTKGALLTRGLAEITRLGVALGAEPSTFAGLSGTGDLITTCLSRYSRNRYVGEEIGKGKTLSQVLENMVMVAEGVLTTKAAYQLAQQYRVEMPITNEVHAVLFEDKEPARAVNDLMMRAAKAEMW
ncbi:MAG: NAD(P)H-dependent glycerol-3-phosphate dehydrogenase [Gemmatimonadota bacterium]|nr:MAG: NAD(P)H-dependent glycerol-3-phosphate dehydrogenase [Gemmatimonadota bacterium]